jgi:putative endonuclease
LRAAWYTELRRPVVLVYTETAETRSQAQKREATIKKLSKQAKEQLITA